MCSLWQDLSDGTINLDHVNFTVTFDLHLENFLSHSRFADNFFTLKDRAFIFCKCMCSLWQDLSDGTINFDHMTLTFDLHLENSTLHITFLPLDIGLSYLACVFLMTRPFWWSHKFWFYYLDHDLSDGTINFDHVTLTFDLHLENFNFTHNFLTIRHMFSYLTCVFLMIRPFWWYHKFWSRDLDHDLWPTFEKR